MTAAADRLAGLLQIAPARLAEIPDAEAASIPSPGRWSKKEILGHLIDSASNNHQRFVRALTAPPLEFPGYEQTSWVEAQRYAAESWPDLIDLWLHLNSHLLHIIRSVPEASLSLPCAIGGRDPIPLSAVISGYVDHLEHHLDQLKA